MEKKQKKLDCTCTSYSLKMKTEEKIFLRESVEFVE